MKKEKDTDLITLKVGENAGQALSSVREVGNDDDLKERRE